MEDDPDLDHLRLELDRAKLDFEKQQFGIGAAKRAEELAKLKAEREKAELEAADLRVPYQQRAAYKTAIFQGRASMVAVIALLASALSLKPLFDASEAKRNEEIAVAARERAKDEFSTADRRRTEAETALKAVQDDKHHVDVQVETALTRLTELQVKANAAKEIAIVAPVDEVLSALGKHPGPEQLPLIENVLNGSAEFIHSRELYLLDVAKDIARPPMLRYLILRSLYEKQQAQSTLAGITVRSNIRQEMLSLIGNSEWTDRDVLPFLIGMDALFGPSIVHSYVCLQYDKLGDGGKRGVEPLQQEVASLTSVTNQYILLTYSDYPECFQASLDSFDSRYPRLDILQGALEVAPEILLLQNAAGLHTMRSDNELLKLLTNTPPEYEGSSNGVELRNTTLRERFPLFVKLVSEPGLKRLRTCSPAILPRLRTNVWIEEQQLESYCPVSSWQ